MKGREGVVPEDSSLTAAGRAAARRGFHSGRAGGQAESIGAVLCEDGLESAIRAAGNVGAQDTGIVTASRQLRAAVGLHTNIAWIAGIAIDDNKDSFTTRSPARAAGARRGAAGILGACCEDKADRRGESQVDQKGSHGFL